MSTNTLITHTRPEFLVLLDQANQAHAALDSHDPKDPAAASALAAWTGACLRLVTSISNRSEALALDGLDGRSSDDWIRYLLSLGITQD